jgi:hypothetical protein
VGYKKNANQKLRDEIDKFNTTADLIVTVGGSVAYEAAKEVATIDFLSLVGTIDEDPPECFWGGVSLESYASNRDRIAILEGKDKIEGGAKITRAEIGLFCNPNSAMHDAEVGHWKFEIGTETQVFTGGNDANGDNNAAAYATDFLPPKSLRKSMPWLLAQTLFSKKPSNSLSMLRTHGLTLRQKALTDMYVTHRSLTPMSSPRRRRRSCMAPIWSPPMNCWGNSLPLL